MNKLILNQDLIDFEQLKNKDFKFLQSMIKDFDYTKWSQQFQGVFVQCVSESKMNMSDEEIENVIIDVFR